jgi:hypothetical protein
VLAHRAGAKLIRDRSRAATQILASIHQVAEREEPAGPGGIAEFAVRQSLLTGLPQLVGISGLDRVHRAW